MRNRINFRRLEAFYAVAQTGSFTAAAKQLNVTQPAISKLISDLERELSINLFERRGNTIEITQVGEILYTEFQSIHAGVDRLLDVAAAVGKSDTGIIKAAALPIYADTVFPELIAQFGENSERVQFLIESLRHDQLLNALISEDVDVCITSTPINMGSIIEHASFEEEAVLIAAPTSKFSELEELSLGKLRDEPFLLFPPSCPFRQALDLYFSAHNFQPQTRMLVRASSVIFELVSHGLGVSIVQSSALKAYKGEVSAIRLEERFFWRYGLVTKRGKMQQPHVSAFISQSIDSIKSREDSPFSPRANIKTVNSGN